MDAQYWLSTVFRQGTTGHQSKRPTLITPTPIAGNHSRAAELDRALQRKRAIEAVSQPPMKAQSPTASAPTASAPTASLPQQSSSAAGVPAGWGMTKTLGFTNTADEKTIQECGFTTQQVLNAASVLTESEREAAKMSGVTQIEYAIQVLREESQYDPRDQLA